MNLSDDIPANPRILIIDDNAQTSIYISDLLSESGYETVACDIALKAIDIVKEGNVDLILLDVVMPDMNGFAVASSIKKIVGDLDFLPIIMVTALSDEEDKIAGLEYADDYITKPFSGDELLARIKSLLRIRKLHRELAQSKDRYQSLYENAPHLYLSIDSKQTITDCNQIFCRTFKMTKREVVGKSICSLVKEEDRTVLEHFLSDLASESKVQQRVFPLIVAGQAEPLLLDMKAVYIGEKKAGVSIVIAMEDVTRRLHLEEEQKIARKQLYRSARLASIGTLASGVAHEMNNPLTAILGFSSALLDRIKSQDAIDPDELQQYLQIINNEAIRCRDIVENLSKFAREGEISFTSTISLVDCLNDALKLINSKAHRSGIFFINKITADSEVIADANKLEQVFVNVFSNCVDFCTEGSTVIITLDDGGRDRLKLVTLRIADDGPGISSEILPKVFDPFFTTKEVGRGTGMGLAICHKIMEECNGNIDIISELGNGTTVILDIPRESEVKPTGDA